MEAMVHLVRWFTIAMLNNQRIISTIEWDIYIYIYYYIIYIWIDQTTNVYLWGVSENGGLSQNSHGMSWPFRWEKMLIN